MTAEILIHRAGAAVSVQDLGREGFLSQGLSRGGAADWLALAEGAALLGQTPDLAAIEIAGSSLELEARSPLWIALTGAPMRAGLGERRLAWNACHLLDARERLRLAAAEAGNFAYLHVAGGIDTPVLVGGRGAHLAAGLGAPLAAGDSLPVGTDSHPDRIARCLPPQERFSGGRIRMLRGPQTALFPEEVRRRFLQTRFIRTARGNRQGVRLGFDGDGFRPAEGLNLVSEVVVPGDVQITGDGTPYVLGVECQTIGGYPRIGTVLPQDLPMVMQATPGSELRFVFVDVETALEDYTTPAALARELAHRARPLVRDPHHIPDLLSYEFVSGVTAGYDLSEEEERP